MKDSYETLEFNSAESLREWLTSNQHIADGIWIKIHKKQSGLDSITYAEVVDVALCFGWIDGLRRSYDEKSYVQKLTPRRAKSLWSKRNIEHVARLIEVGLMTPSGQKEIDRSQEDGRWESAYDGPSSMVLPDSFMNELQKYPSAKAHFDSLNKTARYAIGWQLQTAKTQKTIDARQSKIIQKLIDAAAKD